MPRLAPLRFSFEDADEDVFTCEVGVNVFAFTETDAGIFFVNRKRVDIDLEVVASDRCKTGVTALYAHWEVYVDPFVDAICPAKDMTFYSEGASPWTADGESAHYFKKRNWAIACCPIHRSESLKAPTANASKRRPSRWRG